MDIEWLLLRRGEGSAVMQRSPDCCCWRYPSNVECPACLAVVRAEGLEQGRREATAEIVAWLREAGQEPSRGGMSVTETLDELGRGAGVLALKLDDGDKAKVRPAFKAKKQALQRNADLVDEPPPHDPETGEVETDWSHVGPAPMEGGREPGSDG